MTRYLIKNDAFTLVELVLAVAFSVLLLTGVYGFYNAASLTYSSGVSAQTLQDAANIVINQIIEGDIESGVVYRLSTAVSYMIPNGTGNELYTCGGNPQVAACDTSQPDSELYYCQNSPCSQTSGINNSTARWYYLNSTGTAVIYHHPAAGGGTVEQTIFTAPTGSTLTLRFVPAGTNTPLNDVEIDVALTENLAVNITNKSLINSGSASTYVLLRNHCAGTCT